MTISDVRAADGPQPSDLIRWGMCFALVVLAHGVGMFALSARRDAVELPAAAPLVMIELAPVAVSPVSQRIDLAPGPLRPDAEPTPPRPTEPPEERTELVPIPIPAPPDAVVLLPPEPKKEQRPSEPSVATAPPTSDVLAPRTAAPLPGLGTPSPSPSVSNWQARLLVHLQRHKRYPAEARARHEHGVARLAFSIDRQGRVLSSRIAQSSGSAVLDKDALALIRRAEPFPPPPPEVAGNEIPFTVPIRYNAR